MGQKGKNRGRTGDKKGGGKAGEDGGTDGKGGGSGKETRACHWCLKTRHLQADCRAKAAGKPRAPRPVARLDEEDEEQLDLEDDDCSHLDADFLGDEDISNASDYNDEEEAFVSAEHGRSDGGAGQDQWLSVDSWGSLQRTAASSAVVSEPPAVSPASTLSASFSGASAHKIVMRQQTELKERIAKLRAEATTTTPAPSPTRKRCWRHRVCQPKPEPRRV